MHKTEKVAPGHYIYRNHHVCLEEDYVGPEGGLRRHWSISGEIGSIDEFSSHAMLPQLRSLTGARFWLNAYLDNDVSRRHEVERLYAPSWH